VDENGNHCSVHHTKGIVALESEVLGWLVALVRGDRDADPVLVLVLVQKDKKILPAQAGWLFQGALRRPQRQEDVMAHVV
jgi:hypothetical protein